MAPIENGGKTLRWPVGNPWYWILTGLVLSILALLWVKIFLDVGTPFRILLVIGALLAGGAALTIRLNSSHRAFLEDLSREKRTLALFLLAATFGAMVIASLVLLSVASADLDMPWNWYNALFIFFLVGPIGGLLAFLCFQRYRSGEALTSGQESALLLALAGLVAFLCCWALYINARQRSEWDTMRTFFAVLAAVPFLFAPVMLLPTVGRRTVISCLVLFHFGGILTAVVSAPPTQPWLASQMWGRVYRPYLQFMYLNNSYQFYAPDPGPSTFLWFRMEYEKPDGTKLYRWEEFPSIDETGHPEYPLSINYQRRIALAEQVVQPTPLKLSVPGKKGKPVPNPKWKWRLIYSDAFGQLGKDVNVDALRYYLGVSPKKSLQHSVIPFHPTIKPPQTQYQEPSHLSKLLLKSMSQHLGTKSHPQHPEAKMKRVKIYKVIHDFQGYDYISRGYDPNSPITFKPFYMGEYDSQGNLMDEPQFDEEGMLIKGDPHLYWAIPILPGEPISSETPKNPDDVVILNYARLHAVDQEWVLYPNTDKRFWQEFKLKENPQQKNPLFPQTGLNRQPLGGGLPLVSPAKKPDQ